MRSYNRVTLLGHLGKDAELKAFPSGHGYLTFSMATSSRYTSKSGESVASVQWHNVMYAGKNADKIQELLKKGAPVLVEGKIEYREYVDKRDGLNKKSAQILATYLDMIGSREGNPKKKDESIDSVDDDFDSVQYDVPF